MWHRTLRQAPAALVSILALLTTGGAAGAAGPAQLSGVRQSGAGVTDQGPARSPAHAAAATATVWTGGAPLRMRWNASRQVRPPGQLSHGARVRVRCQLAGETIDGSQRRTAIWDQLSNGRFISDAYVRWSPRRPSVPWCDTARGAPPATRAAFVTWAARQARDSHRRYRVPVSVTVAQAILESGWGRSGLTRDGGSYFGMKCFGTPGPISLGCRSYAAHECSGSDCFRTRAWFRTYAAADRSFLDHARQLATLSRYRSAFGHTRDANRFAIAVHRAGYATSPTYSRNLIKLMREYDLYRFDPGGTRH